MSKNAPRRIASIIKPTLACNLNCAYCYEGSRARDEQVMSIGTLRRILTELAEYHGMFRRIRITWHGGEPLLMGLDFFREVVTIQKELGPAYPFENSIQTNGTLLTHEMLEFFDAHDFAVGLSLDGPPWVHDLTRSYADGTPSFEDVMKAVDQLSKRKRRRSWHAAGSGVIAVLTKPVLPRLDEFYAFFKDNNINVKVNPIFYTGKGSEAREQLGITPEEYGKAMIHLFDRWYHEPDQAIDIEPLGMILASLVTGEPEGCQFQEACFDSFIAIDPVGNVYPCGRWSSSDFLLGNINELSLDEIRRSPVLDRLRRERREARLFCGSCEFLSICSAGCPQNAYSARHQLVDQDIYCTAYKMIFSHLRDILLKEPDGATVSNEFHEDDDGERFVVHQRQIRFSTIGNPLLRRVLERRTAGRGVDGLHQGVRLGYSERYYDRAGGYQSGGYWDREHTIYTEFYFDESGRHYERHSDAAPEYYSDSWANESSSRTEQHVPRRRPPGPNIETRTPGLLLRYTDIACPRRVWLETPRISVVVRLRVRKPAISAAVTEMTLREEVPLNVRIEAPCFEILNANEQETSIPPGEDTLPLAFDLRPLQVGHTRISLDFFQGGNPVGTASMRVEITAHEVSAIEASYVEQSLRIQPSAQSPDLMLYVSYEQSIGQPALIFTLFRAGEVGRTFQPVQLQGNPQTQALHFYDQLTALSKQQDPVVHTLQNRHRVIPAEDIDRQIKHFGQNLWRNLVPSDLKTVYTQERETWRDKTFLIVSDEPYIPWELVWPYGRGWEDEVPWSISFRFTRWLRRDAQGNGHEAPPTILGLKALICLAPSDSDLPAAQQERRFFLDLAKQHGFSDISPTIPAWSQVLGLLEGGHYDWLHVAAHGNFFADAPDADSAIWLQDQRPLTPDTFVGPTIEDHIYMRRPGFVFNACHSGREGWTLTQLGGWSNRLISNGAGLFLGPLWTVNDASALVFAKTFYDCLLGGDTVAESVRQGRLASHSSGDPTWLAYSVYAHPNARVVLT